MVPNVVVSRTQDYIVTYLISYFFASPHSFIMLSEVHSIPISPVATTTKPRS